MRFTKMEGCGNDYIYINGFEEEVKYPDMLAVAMSERHFGVGADGLVLILPSEVADFRMRMFNMDGSEGEMCGNAVRCIGKYVYERGMTTKNVITLETLGGIKTLQLHIQNDIVIAVTADMGEPILEAAQIPVISDKMPVIGEKLQILDKTFDVTCVSMGNPHAVVFMDGVKEMDLKEIGPAFESHERFPGRTNTEFVQVVDESHVIMRVWERGSGETLACGTGACAVAVACALNGKTGSQVDVELLGGVLNIRWDRENDRVYMTGPAVEVYHGEIGLKENNV